MENKINYTLIGLFFVIVVSIAAGFIWWMISYGNNKNEYRSYYILTNDLPNGIKKDSTVKFIGVDAGIVKDIKFASQKDAQIEIELWVAKGLPVKKDSTVVAEIQGITGISYLNIQRGSQNSPIFSDSEKPYITLEESLFQKIGGKASSLTENIDRTLANINKVLNEENTKKISSILKSIDELAANLNNISANTDINGSLENLNNTLLEFQILAKNGSKTLENINSFSNNFSNLAIKLENLQRIMEEKIKSGEYDIKDILSSFSQEAITTFLEFQKTLKEFRQTLFRLEDKPYEFFFKDPQDKDKK
ncbi:MlaD family protein [Campylobacter sp. RM16187]|uniref:MlaD family protein n=1 Tax=Campylobacter sp. RM16187 TaxID=1660063 RepID=UPI0021B5C011|nr:MlaD family protein [Campylobacter sp. RM16187]QKG29313.1 lipid asymmetry ABC transporter MlaABCDEF, periplasmic component MlaD [Campylobacter sp. RM16187]